jgi:hypothetical protein
MERGAIDGFRPLSVWARFRCRNCSPLAETGATPVSGLAAAGAPPVKSILPRRRIAIPINTTDAISLFRFSVPRFTLCRTRPQVSFRFHLQLDDAGLLAAELHAVDQKEHPITFQRIDETNQL